MRLVRKPTPRKQNAETAVAQQIRHERRRYTLAELLAQCDLSVPLGKQEREWVEAPQLGRESI